MTTGPSCPLPLSPLCAIGSGIGDAIGGASGSLANAILSAIVGWILSGANWLLQHIGAVISSTTSVQVRAPWFGPHYSTMVSIAAVLAVPMLLFAAMQAIFQQSPSLLLRAAFVQLPLAGLLTAVAVQLVQLALTATDQLCSVVSGPGGDVTQVLNRIGTALMAMGLGPMPGFVATVGGLLVMAGGLVLWLELLVRAAAVYVAVLFLPLALASLIWPAISHWCRRLVETLAALILSKFVVVAVLSLAAGALGTGTGFDAVLAGGALLLLAAFTPFTLLRLLPMLEMGAVMQLEGARHRLRHAVTSMPAGAAKYALGRAQDAAAPMADPGSVGTGTDLDPGVPGAGGDGDGSAGEPFGGEGPPRGGSDPGGTGSLGGAGWLAAAGEGGVGVAAAGLSLGEGGSRTSEWQAALASLPPEIRGDTLRPPPGGIPLWEGDPIATVRALERLKEYETVEPDGAGDGALPGVQMPLWGGNEPANRFVPGPTDRWPGFSGAGPHAAGSRAGAAEELWTPQSEPADPDVPSEYFFD